MTHESQYLDQYLVDERHALHTIVLDDVDGATRLVPPDVMHGAGAGSKPNTGIAENVSTAVEHDNRSFVDTGLHR